MISMPCPTLDELKSLSTGQLSEDESDFLFDHVRECKSCRSEMQDIEHADDSLIEAIRNAPPSEFKEEPNCQLAVAKALGTLALSETEGHHPQGLLNIRQESGWTEELKRLPKQIGEYEILQPLGRGGMGSVLLARHTKLGRQVALKVLASHRLANGRMRERFEQEMRAIGQLSHPNIVTAHDAREVDGTAVLVTEYIQGMDLGELVQRMGKLPVAEACEIAVHILKALGYTSEQGFVHRDVKPSNIMLSEAGELKLLDLGLARLQYGDQNTSEITGTGQAMGTADYVSPEQVADSRNVDIRADIYSLGCTLFKLLSGNAPFADEQHLSAYAKMNAHVNKAAPSLAEIDAEIPEALDQLIASMLQKSPSQRPQDPIALADAFSEWSQGSNLKNLFEQAKDREPQPTSPRSSTYSERPAPLLQRSIPSWIAVAACTAGIVFGLLMGILIRIEYPDGTTQNIIVPEGGSVTTTYVPDSEGKENTPNPDATQADSRNNPILAKPGAVTQTEKGSTYNYQAVAFGIPVLNDELDAAKQATALSALKSESPKPVIVDKLNAIWFPVLEAAGLDAPKLFQAKHGRSNYVLVKNTPATFFSWGELKGNCWMQTVSRGAGREMEFGLRPELADRMMKLTAHHLTQPLAVILDDQIVAAPIINSPISTKAVLQGNFPRGMMQRVSDAMNGRVLLQQNPSAKDDLGLPNRNPSASTPAGLPKALSKPDPFGGRTGNPFGRSNSQQNPSRSDPFAERPSRQNPFGQANGQANGQGAEADPFGASSPAEQDPFGGGDKDPFGASGADPFGGAPGKPFDNDDDPFGGNSADPFGRNVPPRTTGMATPNAKGKPLGASGLSGESAQESSFTDEAIVAALEGQLMSQLTHEVRLSLMSRKVKTPRKLATLLQLMADSQGGIVKQNSAEQERTIKLISEAPFPKGLSNSRLIRSDSLGLPSWMDREEFTMVLDVDWNVLIHTDVRNYMTLALQDSSVFDEVLKGIAKDPNGPQVEVNELISALANEVYFGVGSLPKGSKRQWLIAAKLSDPVKAERLLGRVLKKRPLAKVDLLQGYLLFGAPESLEATRKSWEESADGKSFNNLKSIGLAFHNYYSTYRKFPGTEVDGQNRIESTHQEIKPYSWRVAILPYLGEEDLFKEYRFQEDWDSEHNLKLLEKMPDVYRSPAATKSELDRGMTNYIGISSPNSALGEGAGEEIKSFTDGLSNTMLVLQSDCDVEWTNPTDFPGGKDLNLDSLPLDYSKPVDLVMADGRVLKLDSPKVELLEKIATRNGGEALPKDWWKAEVEEKVGN